MGSVLREAFWLVVAVALIAGGVIVFQMLGEAREPVVATPVERAIPLVQTQVMAPYAGNLPIRGEGFVQPYRSLTVAAETGGRVIDLHPAVEERARFAEGDILVRLDDRNARATINQIEANVRVSEAQLALTETQLERSRTLRADGIISQDQLDQLLSRQTELMASIDSLQASLEAAELALDYTVVRAPFAGRVLEKHVDLGSIISAGQAVADIYSDDALEIDVPLQEDQAALIPDLFSDGAASARVTMRFAGRDYAWDAYVQRVESRLDPDTRTLAVTVRINNPNGAMPASDVSQPAPGVVPALINAFGRVTIEGASFGDLFAIETTSVRNGSTIWLENEGSLGIYPIDLVLVDGATAYVRAADLPDNAQLVVSSLQVADAGMPIRAEQAQARIEAEVVQ